MTAQVTNSTTSILGPRQDLMNWLLQIQQAPTDSDVMAGFMEYMLDHPTQFNDPALIQYLNNDQTERLQTMVYTLFLKAYYEGDPQNPGQSGAAFLGNINSRIIYITNPSLRQAMQDEV